ncbi:prevent-host-death protein [Actinoplanes sp. CA-131856]
MSDIKTQLSHIIDRAGTPVAKDVPPVGRANRTAIGSLAGKLDLSGDWDSPMTNAEIGAEFGLDDAASGAGTWGIRAGAN